MLKYKLIATDLDGTLLDDKKTISQRTKDAIAEYQRQGGVFTIATGRKEASAKRFAEEIQVTAPIVAFNGAKVVDFIKGTTLRESFLDSELAVKSFTALHAIEKDMVVYSDDMPFISNITPTLKRYMNRVDITMQVIKDANVLLNHPITKILIIDPSQEFDRMLKIVSPIFGEKLNAVSSDDEYLELLPIGVSKGSGLEEIAGILGIPMAETIAIGDHFNDISMIQAAGLGVAVENAREEVLLAADYITADNNHEGVALLLEKVLSGEPITKSS